MMSCPHPKPSPPKTHQIIQVRTVAVAVAIRRAICGDFADPESAAEARDGLALN